MLKVLPIYDQAQVLEAESLSAERMGPLTLAAAG